MRKLTVELAGTKMDLSLSWKTMKELKDSGNDPMLLALESMKEAAAQEKGEAYDSNINFDAQMAVDILLIAHKGAGGSLSEDDIGDLVMEHGVYQSQGEVGKFLAHLLGGKSAEMTDKEVKAEGKRKPPTS